MTPVTGFATGMIAGALWLLFFIGLGLTARNSPGHPLKSNKRSRSTNRSLELDVPSALQTPEPTGSRVRLIGPEGPQLFDPNDWEDPRSERSGRQYERPVLRPVPDLPEPTLQVDPASFFWPEPPLTRPRIFAGDEPPARVSQHEFEPTPNEAEQPELVRAAALSQHHSGAGSGIAGPEPVPPSNMNEPGRPSRPGDSPGFFEPRYPNSAAFSSEPPPTSRSVPPPGYRSGPPTPPPGYKAGPPTPPPTRPTASPSDPSAAAPQARKSGRFAKKGRDKAVRPAAPLARPSAPEPLVAPSARETKKAQKKSRLKKNKDQPKVTVPPPAPPPTQSQPVTPPRPRFNPPFNYVPPGSSTASTRPSYPTVQPSSNASRTWQPPASFSPPASPSLSGWGSQRSEPEPEPEAQNRMAATPPSEPLVPVDHPDALSGNGHMEPAEEEADAGLWLFGPSGANGSFSENVPTEQDPVLPGFIELSMFGNPNSADDPTEQEAEEQSEPDQAQAAWLAAEAWPSPVEGTRQPPPGSEPPTEAPAETVLMEQSWFQEDQAQEEPQVEDWTAPATPWPGETHRPVEESSWADEAPVAESRLSAPETWAESPRAHREEPRERSLESPAAPPGADDPWIQQQQRRQPSAHEPTAGWEQQGVQDPWQEEPHIQGTTRHEGEDVSVRQPGPNGHALPEPVDAPAVQQELSQPDRPGSQNWGEDARRQQPPPRRSQVETVADDAAWPDPVARAAARLKAVKDAIKVENGLAYVLVDDEGRPVLK